MNEFRKANKEREKQVYSYSVNKIIQKWIIGGFFCLIWRKTW